jgi:hypothetical protein
MLHRKLFAVSSIFVLLFLTACGGSNRMRYENAEQAFQRGMEDYERGRWDRSAEFFRGALSFGRATPQAVDAQYYLGWAHYNNREFVLAASEFNRFATMYRNDPRPARQSSIGRCRITGSRPGISSIRRTASGRFRTFSCSRRAIRITNTLPRRKKRFSSCATSLRRSSSRRPDFTSAAGCTRLLL